MVGHIFHNPGYVVSKQVCRSASILQYEQHGLGDKRKVNSYEINREYSSFQQKYQLTVHMSTCIVHTLSGTQLLTLFL